MSNPSKVYWDSSVWIALIKGEVVNGINRFEVPKMILEDAEKGEVTIYTSRLTIVEVHKKKRHTNLTQQEDEKIQSDFFKHEYIKKIDVDNWVSQKARDVAWQYRLAPNDAIHLASAIKVQAEVLHYWDCDFSHIPAEVMLCKEPLDWQKQSTFL